MNEQTSETHKITSRKASRKAWSHFSIKTQEFKTGYSKVMDALFRVNCISMSIFIFQLTNLNGFLLFRCNYRTIYFPQHF